MPIHPTASVSPQCQIAPDAEVGPHCVLTGAVKLCAGVRLLGNVYVSGPCAIGEGTMIYPFACIGFPGQDVKFKPGDPTTGVVIGTHGIIREHATVHAATKPDRPTIIGDRVFMMVNSHVGHDGLVGNNVVMVNNSAIGGHAQLFDNCTLGGGALIHQFNRVGRFAFVSGGVACSADVPPFCISDERNRIAGLNLVGLQRNGFSRDQVSALRRAFRDLFRTTVPREEMIRVLRERGADCPPLIEMAEFVETLGQGRSKPRAMCAGPGRPPRSVAALLQKLGKSGAAIGEEQLEEA
jgi:UDP-N-acetylglucosamine acyltransferase